jgi:DNA-binding transcriptional MerR regulator
MKTDRMDLDELSARATAWLEELGLLDAPVDGRVSRVADPRTVRYYGSLGLIDRPTDYEGHKARYSERHLLQLVAIKALQLHHVPLAQIQARLYGRSDDELRALITSLAPPKGARPHHEVNVVRWREVVLAPGLKVVAEEGFVPGPDEARLAEKFQAAIAALRAQGRTAAPPA